MFLKEFPMYNKCKIQFQHMVRDVSQDIKKTYFARLWGTSLAQKIFPKPTAI